MLRQNKSVGKAESNTEPIANLHRAGVPILLGYRTDMALKPSRGKWEKSRAGSVQQIEEHTRSHFGGFVADLERSSLDNGRYQLACIDVDDEAAFAGLVKILGKLPPTARDKRPGGGPHFFVKVPAGVIKGKKIQLVPERDGKTLVEFLLYRAVLPPSWGKDLKSRREWVEAPIPGLGNVAVLPDAWLKLAEVEAGKAARTPPPPPRDKGRGDGGAWERCRQEILNRLSDRDILSIYQGFGFVPTASRATAQGWLQGKAIRDGGDADKRPSAAVHLGQGKLRGSYNDKRDNKTMSLIDAMIRWKAEADFKGAMRTLAATAGVELPAAPKAARKAAPKSGGGAGVAATSADDAPQVRPEDPHLMAAVVRAEYADGEGLQGLWFYKGEWHLYDEEGGRYLVCSEADMRRKLTKEVKAVIDRERMTVTRGDDEVLRSVDLKWLATIYAALSSECELSVRTEPPFRILDAENAERRNLVSVRNGLVDLDAAVAGKPSCQPHTARWFTTVRLPYNYTQGADCPKWRAFLERNLEGDGERIALLQEFAGYLLRRSTGAQNFLILHGEGGTGKSVVCAVLEAMLGLENVSHVPLEAFNKDFPLTGTLGKLANVCEEVGEIDKAAEGTLKWYTSGGRMTFQRKFLPAVDAAPGARLVFAMNTLPRFSDRTDGLWRRMLLMPFRVKIPRGERTANMDKPWWWEAAGELPGIFNWALDGLRRLEAHGFTESRQCRDAVNEFRTESNPAAVFLADTYEAGDGPEVRVVDAFTRYRRWCEQRGYHPLNDAHFGQEVKRFGRTLGVDVRKVRKGSDGSRYHVYEGIAMQRPKGGRVVEDREDWTR